MIPAPYPWRCIRLPPCPEPLPLPPLPCGIPYVSYGASQKKVAVSYCFDPVLHCPPLAALSDDQREEFKPRWQRRTGTKQLETALFFVCSLGYIGYAAPQEP